MKSYLLTIDIRYKGTEKPENDFKYRIITIGVFNDFEQACEKGNVLLKKLESEFEFHKFPNGDFAKPERFGKNNGAFGDANTLISNLAYLKTPFDFFLKIETLTTEPINEIINLLKS